MLRAFVLLEVGLACFIISDVFLVDGDGAIEEATTTGLRYDGDVYNPPAAGCNKIPCGLGTNNVPASSRLAINLQSGSKIGLHLRIENTTFAGKYGFEFRYGDNPQFALGTSGFPLGTDVSIAKNSDQVTPTITLTLAPSFTANATIQAFFTVDGGGFGGRNTTTYYQCIDVSVKGSAPLPSWAADFGPKEQANYNVDPGGTRGYDCALDPRCQQYMPQLSDWDWLIILCVISFLVLCICICIICLCLRRKPKAVVNPPPEPPPPQEEAPKEVTPSASKASPYAHMVFSDPNDPPSKKSTDSGSMGDKGTGSQGRHFHFHYEEAEPEGTDKPDVVVR